MAAFLSRSKQQPHTQAVLR